jgi:hypothetical protein
MVHVSHHECMTFGIREVNNLPTLMVHFLYKYKLQQSLQTHNNNTSSLIEIARVERKIESLRNCSKRKI